MSLKAMKLALDALNNNRRKHYSCEDSWYSCPKDEDGCANDQEGDDCTCGADKANLEIDAAIAVLRQSIEQAEKQEPVAWVQDVEFEQLPEFAFSWVKTRLHDKPLYTHPPQREWVSLTDDQIKEIVGPHGGPIKGYTRALFDKIDAKLRENNT